MSRRGRDGDLLEDDSLFDDAPGGDLLTLPSPRCEYGCDGGWLDRDEARPCPSCKWWIAPAALAENRRKWRRSLGYAR